MRVKHGVLYMAIFTSVGVVLFLLAGSDYFLGRHQTEATLDGHNSVSVNLFHEDTGKRDNFNQESGKLISISLTSGVPSDTLTHGQNTSLSQGVINGVKKFVIFIGYPRSGHSIVGSLMDAHPHMVIAHEFQLFEKLAHCRKMDDPCLKTKSSIFNALYRASAEDSRTGWRSDFMNSKKYTLSVDSPWLGAYDRYITIIGDKRGGGTARFYHESPNEFKVLLKSLRTTVGVPIKALHCARNPYDMVSTNALYLKSIIANNPSYVSSFKSMMSKLSKEDFERSKFNEEPILKEVFDLFKDQADAVMEISKLLGGDNVLELHNNDLVEDPKWTLRKICSFLEVDCSAEYLDTCSKKVYKSVSKSRDLVVWPERLRSEMERVINKYPFLHRYSFTDNQ